MGNDSEIVFYRGKPLADYSKDKLIEIVLFLVRQNQNERDRHSSTLNMWSNMNKARKMGGFDG